MFTIFTYFVGATGDCHCVKVTLINRGSNRHWNKKEGVNVTVTKNVDAINQYNISNGLKIICLARILSSALKNQTRVVK